MISLAQLGLLLAPRRLVAVLATLRHGGYGALRHAAVPMRTVSYASPPETDRLLLLLPGRHDSAQDFGRHGFPEKARQAGLAAEVVAAEAHLGYYARRVVHTRLWKDVVIPARARGRRSVWIGGISLGALGSVIVGHHFPGQINGLILIAPYLGPDALVREIKRAGGLARWAPCDTPDGFSALWAWLGGYADRRATRPPLILAYGTHDRYASAHRLLAAVLPPDRVITQVGGHDWITWDALWRLTVRHPLVQRALGGEPSQESTPG